jgi:dephospho-CoA kinase
LVLGDDAALARLEAIVHPLVAARERNFWPTRGANKAKAVVARRAASVRDRRRAGCDAVVVVSAPPTCSGGGRSSGPA